MLFALRPATGLARGAGPAPALAPPCGPCFCAAKSVIGIAGGEEIEGGEISVEEAGMKAAASGSGVC